MDSRTLTRGTLGLAALALLTGCVPPGQQDGTPTSAGSPAASAPAATGAQGPATPRTVVTGLEAPWSIAFTAESVPLVSQRDDGTIMELVRHAAEDTEARPVGVVEGIDHGGEGGLLGLAVVPDPEVGEWVYAYSTGQDGNRVQRFPLEGARGSLNLGTPETVIDGLPRAGIHNGGRIALGPDGMLYVATGDAGTPGSAQNPEDLGGKILRLTEDGQIPPDNPDPDSPVYSMGHRNVQGLAWDQDGTMFATEFGQDTWDELNVIEPGGNYGWPEVEGTGSGTGGRFIDPVQQWPTDQASPSGLAVVDGTLFIANLRGEVLRTVPVSDLGTSEEWWEGEYGRLRDAVVSPDGGVWVLTNNTDGRGTPTEGDDRILVVEPGS